MKKAAYLTAPLDQAGPGGPGSALPVDRRNFLKLAAVTGAGLALRADWNSAAGEPANLSGGGVGQLPKGSSPAPLDFPHFPDRLHAFIWRNWSLVPAAVMAGVVRATTRQVQLLGHSMGLEEPGAITPEQRRRSYITVIRRNWHLLAYDQLLQLLEWTPEEMAFTLREDDFLFVKLGNLKPACEPLRYTEPSATATARAEKIAEIVRTNFPESAGESRDPLFGFVSRLSSPHESKRVKPGQTRFAPRFCHSYFALYGDPLLETEAPAYPDGYLARLADSGVDGVWLQGLLQKLAPFPWDAAVSARHLERLAALRDLVQRAGRQGIGVYLYLNEPRSMPLAFFEARPDLKGTVEGAYATMCTSQPEVRKWLADAVAFLCHAVPSLAGLFTISASENLTNCWSHNKGSACSRCGKRSASDVIAEFHTALQSGIAQAGNQTRLFAWDWGWRDTWTEGIITQLPREVALMSVSEWSMPIRRGGVENRVGEYSISVVGPGPRARRNWELARRRGLKTLAKIQAGNTWELSAVPYIPALENVARHAANLVEAKVDGLMLGWTLGGYPSPNLEVVREVARLAEQEASQREEARGSDIALAAMKHVAVDRFGERLGPDVVQAWREFSAAFSEFPYDGNVVYTAPLQAGPANLLWGDPTKFAATMVGIPYDDLDAWRGPYPPDVFIAQLRRVADGFETGIRDLKKAAAEKLAPATEQQRRNLMQELDVAEAAAIHFASVANQARFVEVRRALAATSTGAQTQTLCAQLREVLRSEIGLARRLHAIQSRDSRIGFEATNQYFYVPLDLVEKVVNCRDLIDRWLPTQSAAE